MPVAIANAFLFQELLVLPDPQDHPEPTAHPAPLAPRENLDQTVLPAQTDSPDLLAHLDRAALLARRESAPSTVPSTEVSSSRTALGAKLLLLDSMAATILQLLEHLGQQRGCRPVLSYNLLPTIANTTAVLLNLLAIAGLLPFPSPPSAAAAYQCPICCALPPKNI